MANVIASYSTASKIHGSVDVSAKKALYVARMLKSSCLLLS